MSCRIFLVSVIGVVLCICGILGLTLIPHFIKQYIVNMVAITTPESFLFNAWSNPSSVGVNLYRSFYWFNLTNPDEVMRGIPPNFNKVGPFVYLEDRRKIKTSIEWFVNGSVGYRYETLYHFVTAKSIDEVSGHQLAEEDDITMVNAAILGISYRLSRVSKDIEDFGFFNLTKQDCCEFLNAEINNCTLGPKGYFIRRPVKELLWKYQDPIWESLHFLLELINYKASTMFRSEWNVTNTVPSPYTFRSGQKCPLWTNLSECNSTNVLLTIEGSGAKWERGTSGGNISVWAGQSKLWWWGPALPDYDTGSNNIYPQPTLLAADSDALPPSNAVNDTVEECQKVEGSDGMRFAPETIDKTSALTIFMDMIWRKFRFVFLKESSVRGIETLRFAMDPSELDNTTLSAKYCYDIRERGIFNVSRPIFGPGLVSKTFFLDAVPDPDKMKFTLSDTWSSARLKFDQYLDVKYGGRQSDKFRERFESYVDIHALTGLTLRGNAQGMVWTVIEPLRIAECEGVFSFTNGITPTYYPGMIIHRFVEISPHWADKLSVNLMLINLLHVGSIFLIVFGGITIISAVVVQLRKSIENAEEKLLLQNVQ